MSINLPTHYFTEFDGNVQHLLQYKGSKLRGKVMEGAHSGKGAAPIDYFGTVRMLERSNRFEDMPNVNINTDRLWLYPRHFHLPQLIDDLDLLQTLTDPKGPMTEAAVNAVGHKIDEVCMAAMFGTRKTGETGATDSAFTPSTSTNQVAVTIGNGGSGNVGLNVEKLLKAKRLLRQNFVNLDSEMPCMVISPQEEEDLLNIEKFTSTDYNYRPRLDDSGRLGSFLGIEFIVIEDTNLFELVSTHRACPMFVKSGIHLGFWKQPTSRIDDRADKSGVLTQLYVNGTWNATRTEEGKVVQVLSAVS